MHGAWKVVNESVLYHCKTKIPLLWISIQVGSASTSIALLYCMGQAIPNEKKNLLSTGTETRRKASAQGLQNAIYNECHTKFFTKLWAFGNRQFVCGLYVARLYTAVGKSSTNNLPASTDLTENPDGKKNFF